MGSLKSTIADGVRRLLPLDSGPRKILAGTNQGLKAAAVAFNEVIDRPERTVSSDRTFSYTAWRRQQGKNADRQVSPQTPMRFVVFIDVPTGTTNGAVRRTMGSVDAQLGSSGRAVPLRSGDQLDIAMVGTDEQFVLILRPGSLLDPFAFSEIAREHRKDPSLQVIVFDSDTCDRRGRRADPLFRPKWSPEMLLGANYVGRAFAVHRSFLANRPTVTLSDDGVWGLLLDKGLSDRVVGNVHNVLLSEPHGPKQDVTAGQASLVQTALEAWGESAKASVENGVVRVKFEPTQWPTVSIVIASRHSRSNLGRLLPSLATTHYPEFDVTIIDNGGESDENNAWYAQAAPGLNLNVRWWTEAFNYSRVNNAAASLTQGSVLLFLNDDTEIVDPDWLSEIVGMLMRDGVGTVGLQLRQGDGLIQHGGVVIGPGGFADNTFAGMVPGSNSLIGSTAWYRNSLAVTAACVAIRREHFEEVGGFDERFLLTGSDVVLGLDQIIRGRRNVVIPFDTVRHFESLTRGTAVPQEDFYASYWRYHPWLQNGDPYSSPNVSRMSAIPRLRRRNEVSPVKLALAAIGRNYGKLAQSASISEEASALLTSASVSEDVVEAVRRNHSSHDGFAEVKTVNWFIPDIDMPFFGGLNTAFRIADKLAREHGVVNRFIVLAAPNNAYVSSALAAAFPGLANSEIVFYSGQDEDLTTLPPADAAVATLWLTAMHVAKSSNVKRKFYLMQDYEPSFYPASTLFAMAEESYRLGLYGICNTPSMHSIYTDEYGGEATYFVPAVDRSIYHTAGRREKGADEPVTIFAYARDHFRNCWELVFEALSRIKQIHGDGVRIVAAGARYLPESADFIDMGLLDYRATGSLYRETDIGLTMQISRHPSYLPLELMASGVPMVAPDSRWFDWLFRDGENSLLTMRTLDDLVAKLDRMITDVELRKTLAAGAAATIDHHHSSWDAALAHIYDYMCNPTRSGGPTNSIAR